MTTQRTNSQHSANIDPVGIPMDPAAFTQDVFANDSFEDNHFLTADGMDYAALDDLNEPIQHGKELFIDVEGIIALTARLSQILAQEADHLANMQVSEIERLQKEKLHILDALEAHKRLINMHPELLKTLSDDDCLELAQIVEIFQSVMKENHRRLLVAREVNRQVVDAITDAVQESTHMGTYGAKGVTARSSDAVSLTLNQTF